MVTEEAQDRAENEKEEAVAYVSKHDGEEKREGNAGKNRWVGFLITSNAISINHFLEAPGKLIRFKKGRRGQTRPFYLLDKH